MALDAGTLAAAMQAALPRAWADAKGEDISKYPGDPADKDQLALFLAIARGILAHVRDHQNDMAGSVTLTPSGGTRFTSTVNAVSMNITGV